MTDKELLEFAAKAAGLFRAADRTDCPINVNGVTYPVWNPLEDDGDALRLAVRMEMDLFVRAGRWTEAVRPMGPACKELHGDDPDAATRRAIVRAAAESAKVMP